MFSRILIILSSIFILSCGNNGSREYGNIFGGIGRSSSFEKIESFQSQQFFEYTLDSLAGATSAPHLLKDRLYIFSTDDGRILCASGKDKKWEYKLDSGSFIGAGFASDNYLNIYTIDNLGRVYSLDSSGNSRFSKQLFEPSKLEIFNTPLSLGNNVIFSSSDGNLSILDSLGNILYNHKYNSSILDYISAIDDENILITLSNNKFGVTDTLVCLSSKGIEKWRFSADGFRFVKGAITNGSQISLSGSLQGGDNPLSKIFYLDRDGKLMWEKEISNIPRFLSMSEDGELYLISYSSGMGQMLSGIFAYDKKGEMIWKIYYDYSIPMPIYITKNELMFIASNRETYALFYLQRSDGVLIRSLEIGGIHPIVFYPEIEVDGSIVFAGKEKLRLIRVDATAINKILPY
ncbi:MAG: hypothetical protein R2863_08170 [Candidatus Kapaibacterium sp.]